MKIKCTLLALLMFLSVFASACSDTDAGTADTTASADTTEAVSTEAAEPEYVWADLDFKEGKLNILNTNTTWGFYTTIYFDEQTGALMDDAIYDANRKVEEKFNVVLNITESDINSSVGEYTNAILAGDGAYDTALTSANRSAPLLLQRYVADLTQFSELQLDQPWWNQNIMQFSSFGDGGHVFFGVSDINMMSFEVLMGIYVNDDMLADLNIPKLYDTVREGKWTVDKMHECMKAAANLHGDADFTYNSKANATYGLTYWDSGIQALMYGAGLSYVVLDEKNNPSLNMENDNFYNIVSNIAEMFVVSGEAVYLNSSKDRMHYEDSFADGRTLFTVAQLKGSTKFREMEDDFGILPLPKANEEQQDYIGFCSGNVVASTIPKSNTKPNQAAGVIDAMAYLAYSELRPVYEGVVVEQRQMRNADSIEMLQIMGANRVLDVGNIYSWTTDLHKQMFNKIKVGDSAVASIVASTKSSIEALFKDTIAAFSGE